MGEEIVIIGCGASGGTAAQFARKTNRKAKILRSLGIKVNFTNGE